MTGPLTLDAVTAAFAAFGPAEQANKNRIKVKVPAAKIRDAVQTVLRTLGCDRLITISAADTGTRIDLVYHFTGLHGPVIGIAVELPRENPEIPTVADMLPPAGLYERQIHDLIGVVFAGNPCLDRLMLNEDWPEGEYPMRKDWKPDPAKFYGGIRKEVV
jgi:NADH-quinone oxidoreductase subunit C